jgi:transposase, IS6 family
VPLQSAFAGFGFPAEVITLAVRWYLRFGLSYRDVERCWPSEVSRSITSPSTGWVQRFTPLFADTARFARQSPGDRWFVNET